MFSILQMILEHRYTQIYLDWVYHLNDKEIKILIFITAFLIATVVLRWFGATLFFVLLFVYLLVYIIYSVNFFDTFFSREEEHNRHMDLIDSYIDNEE